MRSTSSVAPYPPPSTSHQAHPLLTPASQPASLHLQSAAAGSFVHRSDLSLTTAAVFEAAGQLSPSSMSRSSNNAQVVPYSNHSSSAPSSNSTGSNNAPGFAHSQPQQLRGVQRGSILNAMRVDEEEEEDDDEQHHQPALNTQPATHSTPHRTPVLAASHQDAHGEPLLGAQFIPSTSSLAALSLSLTPALSTSSDPSSPAAAVTNAGRKASLVPQSALSFTPRNHLGTDEGGLVSARERTGSAARRGKPLTLTGAQ